MKSILFHTLFSLTLLTPGCAGVDPAVGCSTDEEAGAFGVSYKKKLQMAQMLNNTMMNDLTLSRVSLEGGEEGNSSLSKNKTNPSCLNLRYMHM
jgi:hypothetical protein